METSSAEHVLERPSEPAPFLFHIEPHMMPQAWPVIEPILSKACSESEGEVTINRILANLEHWPILAIVRGDEVQAVMVTYLSEREGGGRTLHCMLAGGSDARGWTHVDDQFDEFARSFGCDRVRIDRARKGWAKTLPHWKIRGYVMEREI